MKRVFVAIDIPLSARETVARYIASLRLKFPGHRIGWERPEKLHLTLKFLGDVGDVTLGKIQAVLTKTAGEFEGFVFRIEGTGVFPDSRRPRVLWLGIDAGDPLKKIAKELELRFEKMGFPIDQRTFKPHLTIARVREPERSANVAEEHLRTEFRLESFEASEIVLYQSVLAPTGSEYTRLRSFAFRKI